jgi:5'-nucleotidase
MVSERGGARIALIGLVTEETPALASPGPRLRFSDAAEATARAIAAIRAAGPATIIVLSHRGYAADCRMAAEVAGIDAIIGGHSHTILANRPGAEGPHPVLVEGVDRPVRIVQAGALGRFFGRLDLDIAADGKVAAHGGEATELDASFAASLGELRARAVATAQAAFELAGCRQGECAIGNLIAEAMLAAAPTADIALQNGGGIRAGFPAGTISYGDVLTALPFSNTLATATLRGGALLAALENGLSRPGEGRFPQVAGLRLVVDFARPAGSRIVSATVTRGERAGPVEPDRAYRLVTNNFLRRGGDGYVMLRDQVLEAYDTGPLLEEVVAAHLAAQSPLAPRTDGRITTR